MTLAKIGLAVGLAVEHAKTWRVVLESFAWTFQHCPGFEYEAERLKQTTKQNTSIRKQHRYVILPDSLTPLVPASQVPKLQTVKLRTRTPALKHRRADMPCSDLVAFRHRNLNIQRLSVLVQ